MGSATATKERFITTSEAAKISGYTIQHVRLLIRRKKLQASKLGRDWVIDKDTFKSSSLLQIENGKQPGGKNMATLTAEKKSSVNTPKISKKPTVVSLFSGCGGIDVAFKQAGFDVLWANDIDQYACETYRNYIGDHIVCGDIEKIPVETIPKADVVVGGFPCQDFSIIWKQPGLNGKRAHSRSKTMLPSARSRLPSGEVMSLT
jgi:excisionase family DNA binding protein